MVIKNPSDLKKKRKRLGISQSELAEKAGFSQPLVARIEREDIDPRFSTFEKLKKALKNAENRKSKKARDLMSSPIIYASSKEKIFEVTEKMVKNDISQIPIIEKGIQKGSITESTMVNSLSNRDVKEKNMRSKEVEKVMDPPFPTLSDKSSLEEVMNLLKSNQAVLVSENGDVAGIVTKADVIDLM